MKNYFDGISIGKVAVESETGDENFSKILIGEN